MRFALLLPSLTILACASAPATGPSTSAAAKAAPTPAPVKAAPALDEPVGTASARISGPVPAFTAACQDAMARARAGLDAVKASRPPRDTVATLTGYDDALAAINDLDAQSELARQGSPDPAMRQAAEECDRQIQAMGTSINQDRALYDVLSALDLSGQDVTTRWWMTRDLREFRRAGVDRDETTREKVRALSDELVAIGQEFDRNIPADVRKVSFTRAELAGMPADFLAAHPPGPDGKIVLTTDYPDYFPVRSYARQAKTREALWRAFMARAAPQNIAVLERLLVKRQELAHTLGYANWADYATENKMIRTGKAASDFIERITAASGDRAAREKKTLLARKRKDVPGARALDPWDIVYYGERVKAERYHFDAQSARPYFEASRVFQGVLDVSGKLFDLSYRAVENAVVWHPDVRTFDVIAGPSFGDRAGKSLGRIYLDLHPREGKFKHAAEFTVVSGQAGHRLPEGALLCNFPRAGGLMEYDDVRVLFHEFGHLVHHVLGGHTRWAANSGVRTEQDFVEAPSQMLEEWVRDPGVLQVFARQVKTGQPIPAKMVEQLRIAEEFGKGLEVRRQMFLAAVSLHLHDREARGLDSTAVVAESMEKYWTFPYVKGMYIQASFGHLNGYSAVYYTYMWSLVIAKDMFTPFESRGVFDRPTAARYRERVLEQGGGKPAADLVADFLGRPYDFKAYERWLER
ncbi:MAG TPA: M3 family metallopeptidase [Myxococcaceae bacterium]|nr:M3 family metallopeptidase [Myxococcaceae bacterium]